MRLIITASPSYTGRAQPLTPDTPLTLTSPSAKTTIHFTTHPNRQQCTFSLTLATTFTRPLPTHHLTWGNDFDNPIRHYLPPKWKWAMGIVRWAADPGLEEGLEEDKPWVRGPAVGSFNRICVPEKEDDGWKIGGKVVEGWKGLREEDQEFGRGLSRVEFEALRETEGDDDAALKRRRAVFGEGKKGVVLPEGREVRWEFFNGFLDLEKFALNLPGFRLNILNYWDGQPIRFVLKEVKEDGSDGEVFVVISFTIDKEEHKDDDEEDSDESGESEYEDAESGDEGKPEAKPADAKKPDVKDGPVAEDVSELD
ncbi:hypothetical protein BJ508DRAFT_412976 [Ascobolus immersus RN42]|uniref:Domain of unknown function at the cortex 1 domain-containing protein n=1 Tax=Ascobolus immersus RN42 TaxID=1160509 RepID=A0A3N4ICS5_ASCIM|nr:hypothetical protein BJ508DRAFT_412976 [Ascobolus immersus RN42]